MPRTSLLLLLPFDETLRRLPRVVLGVWLFGVGIAAMVYANLGGPPWDVFHQGVAAKLGLSIGTVIIATGGVLVLAFIPLGEQLGLGTLLNVVLVGVSADVTLACLPAGPSMWTRALLCAAGPVIVAAASGLYLSGGLGPGPRDGLMTGIGRRGFTIWKVRTAIEVGALVIGVLLGGTIGVGTAWFALSIGPLVQFCLQRLTPNR
ncbi:MAG: hypothetical protein CMJ88_02175 [Planctomycetes bacterium]|nr:hypothetical protein [Planctomycetota bacterium]